MSTKPLHIIAVEDAIKASRAIPDDYLHLTITSPPYDGIRDYGGKWSVDFPSLGKELLRATAPGGAAVVVIQDGTKNGHKSGTTARLICTWLDAGWGLFETCIWERSGTEGAWWNTRFRVDHEYIIVFVKGQRLRAFNKKPLKVPCKYAGTKLHGSTRASDGSMIDVGDGVVNDTKCRGTVWKNRKSNIERNKIKSQHPATFPDSLAADIITCFSAPGDIVFDPFLGSGTTVVQAIKLGRVGIGTDINPEYIQIAKQRVALETQ